MVSTCENQIKRLENQIELNISYKGLDYDCI